jgi:hypothetical protein
MACSGGSLPPADRRERQFLTLTIYDIGRSDEVVATFPPSPMLLIVFYPPGNRLLGQSAKPAKFADDAAVTTVNSLLAQFASRRLVSTLHDSFDGVPTAEELK